MGRERSVATGAWPEWGRAEDGGAQEGQWPVTECACVGAAGSGCKPAQQVRTQQSYQASSAVWLHFPLQLSDPMVAIDLLNPKGRSGTLDHRFLNRTCIKMICPPPSVSLSLHVTSVQAGSFFYFFKEMCILNWASCYQVEELVWEMALPVSAPWRGYWSSLPGGLCSMEEELGSEWSMGPEQEPGLPGG